MSSSSLLVFFCPACQKKLSTKADPAGKTGKCPGCGQLMAFPVPVACSATAATLPPPPPGQGQQKQPLPIHGSDALTNPPPSESVATLGAGRGDAGHDPSLTEFLALAQADDELGRLGKYRVLKILGHGGMGVVYKAEDPILKRSVAIKAMLPTLAASDSAGKRFLREAQAMAAVKHDHVATIYQVEEERGIPFLAMEFLAGQPLDERLKREGKLPLGEVLRIGREIAEGLDAAHSTGLIHRDIKPANIWLEAPRNRVKILDFGLARGVAQDPGPTQQGAIVGTPAYMAPEQARGEAVDARCDLFSLGCVLYRMCTGHQPFKGKDVVSTLLAVALEKPPPPIRLHAGIPRELSDLVMRLLEKAPDRRPASAGEVVRILAVLQRNPALATATTAVVPTPTANPWEDITEPEPVGAPMEPAVKAKSGRRTPLLAALGLLALVPLGWWLAAVLLRVETANGTLLVEINDAEVEARIKNGKLLLTGPDGQLRYTLTPSERSRKIEAGRYGIRVVGADGLVLYTREFTLEKGGKVTVRVTLPPQAVVKKNLDPDPDRKAAEYGLSIGGLVRVNGQDREIKAADLPREPFRLTWVYLRENKRVSDAGLAHFKGCKNLTHLNLFGTQVSDTGLAHFRDCKSLTYLDLWGCSQVSDAGLAHFKDCKNLTHLGLNGTQMSDTGLAHFKDCKNLMLLDLASTQVSDAGLAHFKDCKNLTVLDLGITQVSDAGLAHFKDCKNLNHIELYGTQVSGVGLAHLKSFKNLRDLWLQGTQVSDTGLDHLKDCKSLTHLNLHKTKVTRAKIEELKKALPKCKIEWTEM